MNKLTKELDDLCLTNTYGLHVSEDVFDDGANKYRGYSWTKNREFIKDKQSLLAAMLKDPSKHLAKVDDPFNV